MKALASVILIAISNACLANTSDFSRTAEFTPPEKFVKVARNFRPASERSEFSYFFSAPERGNDDSTYGKLVFAEAIEDVTELWRGPDLCAYFLQASPKTEYTRSYVAALLLLHRSIDSQIWRITTVERFQAIGAGGGIHCRVLRQPEKSAPLTFRVTETDAGRRDVSEERVYTLAVGNGIRLKSVNTE